METTSTFTQADVVENIFAQKAICKSNSILKRDLQAMDLDTLIALAKSLSISLESAPAVAPVELVANGITPRTALNGTIVYTMDLELVHTDGYSFHFAFGDKKVVIAGDLALSDCFASGSIKVGDMIPFHYHGADSFKLLSTNGSYLVPNNNQENPSRGTIAKSFCEPIQAMLALEKLDKAKENLEMLRIAKASKLKVRDIRNLDREDRVADARAMLAELRKR
jgi:hypothetical protein